MAKLTNFVVQQQAQLKLPRLYKRQRSYLQQLIGSDDGFEQLAVAYVIARLSHFEISPDPYKRFPVLCEAG